MTSTDIAKLATALALVAGGIAGYYWLGDSALVLRILPPYVVTEKEVDQAVKILGKIFAKVK